MNAVEKLRTQCLKRGASGIAGLGRLFRIMDDNGNHALSHEEFRTGLQDYGILLREEDFAELVQVFALFRSLMEPDRNGDGSIDFDEFLINLRPPMNAHRQELVSMAFNKIDKTGDGVLTVADVAKIYSADAHPKYRSGELTKEQVFGEFLKSFDTPNAADGVVTKEEFLNYYSAVSSSIDNDAYFSLMMRQAWKL